MSGIRWKIGKISPQTQLYHPYIIVMSIDDITKPLFTLEQFDDDDVEYITIQDIIDKVGENRCFTIFAESYMDGVIIRYNNENRKECYVVGTTIGFA